MFHIILDQPRIPPNTGNIIRLCANAGARLHLVHPLGFELNEKQVRRAGLDYHDMAIVQEHASLPAVMEALSPDRVFAFSTRGRVPFASAQFQPGDGLLFGSETSGLSDSVLDQLGPTRVLRLPMCHGNRSLNLSNTVAIALYEAWRQHDYAGAKILPE